LDSKIIVQQAHKLKSEEKPLAPIWRHLQQDREFFQRELEAFVPERIFDSHIHLGPRSGYGEKHAHLFHNCPEIADKATYLADMSWLFPQREILDAVAIPNDLQGNDIEATNRFVAENSPACHALLVHPNTSTDKILESIAKTRPSAIKCYHLMTGRLTMDAYPEEYLPESMAAAAHEAKLPIIVHLVRPRALADEGNQAAINKLCRKYPDMTMVLAHVARGLNPAHTITGIDHVKGLDNLYFDASSVTECGAMEAILKVYGHERLMWGTDYPFSHFHGRCVALNDSFVWLYDDTFNPGPLSPDPELQMTLVGLESLRTLKYACQHCRLSDAQIEAIFCDNAQALYTRSR
jgi:predicted TIM-barrel fold metal-dependent hydrolase